MLFLKRVLAFFVFICILSLTGVGWNFFPRFQKKSFDVTPTAHDLRTTVRYLSEDIGIRNLAHPESLEKAAVYIEQSLKRAGLPVESWEYKVRGQTFRNIVSRYKNNDSDEYIVIGAHYDSCYNPGADDNASGIAGVLWLAKELRHIPLKANLLFVAFTNEEPPFFQTRAMGSRVFVDEAGKKKIGIRYAIILEMIGFYDDKWFSQKYFPLIGPFYPNRANFITVIGNYRSRKLAALVKNGINKEGIILAQALVAPENIPGINFSDHASFWLKGIPAAMITDTAYLRNANYHQLTDTVNTINFQSMAAVVESVKNSIIHSANSN
ncbi:MAG: M28 family peptidase [Candidatus Omnitrophota bacterium]